MFQFFKIIKTLRKSTLEDIARKSGLNVDGQNKEQLADSIEAIIGNSRVKRKFIHTIFFQISFPVIIAIFFFFLGRFTDVSNSEVIERTSVENVLNFDIENLTLLLELTQELTPDSLINEGFLIRISSRETTLGDPGFQVLLKILETGNADGLQWGFQSASIVETRRLVKRYGDSWCLWENSLRTIPLPVSLRLHQEKPFNKVRDLDESDIEVFMPKNISELIEKVYLVANSGYMFKKYIKIFEREVLENDWEDTDYDIDNNFSDMPIKKSQAYVYCRRKNVNDNRWLINLKESKIVYREKPLADGLRVSY